MSSPGVKADVWLTEYTTPWDMRLLGASEVLVHTRTEFQTLAIVRSPCYGKSLVLDGAWQTSEVDEFLYHEPLCHVPCVFQGGPERALILGGGDGGALREVLRWRTVKQAMLVDLDSQVVESCKKLLPEIHQGSFDDPRAEIRIQDAFDVLDSPEAAWDVIISDLSDPTEEGPAFKLFTKEFFAKCRRALAPGGCFVIQAGPVTPPLHGLHARLANTLAQVFLHTASYASTIPTYGVALGFCLGADAPLTPPAPDAVDELLSKKVDSALRFLDGTALLGLLHTPKYLRQAIAAETTVYSLDAPASWYHKDKESA